MTTGYDCLRTGRLFTSLNRLCVCVMGRHNYTVVKYWGIIGRNHREDRSCDPPNHFCDTTLHQFTTIFLNMYLSSGCIG